MSATTNLSEPSQLYINNESSVDIVSLSVIKYPRGATVFAAICSVIFIVVGVIGNLVTVLALARSPKLRNATTAFVISLCVADLLFCSINLPLTTSRYIHEDWILGEALCELFPFFFYGNVAASLMSMTAITINRFVLINYPARYDQIYQKRNVILMIGLYWIFSFAIMVPPLLKVWGQLGFDAETFSCTILSHEGRSPKKFLFILGFLLPCLVITISYSCIFYKVRQSRRNLTSSGSTNGTSAALNHEARRAISSLLKADELRLTKLMLIIFCSFLLCFLPLMVVNVFDNDFMYPTIHVIASILAWMSSAINPIIYAAINRQYRHAYYGLLCSKRSPLAPSGTSRSSSGSSACSKTLVSDAYVFNALTNKMEVKSKRKNGQHEQVQDDET